MRIRLGKELQREIKKISKKHPKLLKAIEKQLKLFSENPRHKSLRVHKLSGELKDLWSISVTRELRMLYIQDEDEAYFFDLGTHDQVYRK